MVIREAEDRDAPVEKRPQDAYLDPAVEDGHKRAGPAGDHGRGARGDLVHEALLRIGGGGPQGGAQLLVLGPVVVGSNIDHAAHHSFQSQELGEAAGVNPGSPGRLLPRAILRENGRSSSGAERSCRVRSSPDLDPLAFEERESVAVPRVGRRDAVVTEERVSEREDLAPERGIGEGLWIPHHPGREDDLADAAARGAESDAVEPKPVLEK